MAEPVSKLQADLDAGGFVVTGEIGPPKGTNVGPVLHEAEHYLNPDIVSAVNVTDNQTAVMRMGSLPVCKMLVERGIEPVFQMVTRDRNRIALLSDLLGAYALGIRNVLCLTGDHVTMGDHPESAPVYDLDSVGLLMAMGKLEAGTDLGLDKKGRPNALDGTPTFFRGCCVTPCAEEVEPQIIKLEKKAEAGAQFCQTQAVYDPKAFESFMNEIERRNITIPILVGIVVLKSAGMAKYMNRSVPGVVVPDALVRKLSDTPKEDRQKVTTEMAGELIRDMRAMCHGAHIMALGWDHLVPGILQAAGLR